MKEEFEGNRIAPHQKKKKLKQVENCQKKTKMKKNKKISIGIEELSKKLKENYFKEILKI